MAAYGPDLKIYFFIGRLNPPHEGHIAALQRVIQEANAEGAHPLILLGSGPKKERTLDNPIPFSTKSDFLSSIFLPQGLVFSLREMSSALPDLCQWYTDVLSHSAPPNSVEFVRVAGDKGDNASKFDYLIAPLSSLGENVSLTTIALPPIESGGAQMSATKVRKDAYAAFMSDRGPGGLEQFGASYGWFYGEYTAHIYKDIIFPALELSNEQIQEYLDTSRLPKSKKASSSKKK